MLNIDACRLIQFEDHYAHEAAHILTRPSRTFYRAYEYAFILIEKLDSSALMAS
jgi:hypothetical protein